MCLLKAEESSATVEDISDSCLSIKTQAMEITLKDFPVKFVNIPWRNNNLSSLNADPPLSENGETLIGVYLLVLGKSTIIYWTVQNVIMSTNKNRVVPDDSRVQCTTNSVVCRLVELRRILSTQTEL